jgi:hypothetical protein
MVPPSINKPEVTIVGPYSCSNLLIHPDQIRRLSTGLEILGSLEKFAVFCWLSG